jgi:hypothetical protein
MKKIIIDKPCTVKWGSMKKIDAGRFCSVCRQEVRDYSNKSAAEITEMIEELSNQKFCAKFNEDHVIVLDNNRRETPIFRYFAASIMTVLLLFGCKTKKKTVYSSPRFMSFDDSPKTEQTRQKINSVHTKNSL